MFIFSGTLYNKSVSGVWHQSESVRHVWRGNATLTDQFVYVFSENIVKLCKSEKVMLK